MVRRASQSMVLGSICACTFALASAPGESSAIEPPPPGAIPIPPPRGTPNAPRLRFGIGGAGVLTTTPLYGMIAGPYEKVGVQASDLLGAYAHVSATTSLATYDFRGALIVDLTFADRVSIGTGGSAQAYFVFTGDPYVLFGAPIHVAVYAQHYPGLDAA